jgi:hypothetical protein
VKKKLLIIAGAMRPAEQHERRRARMPATGEDFSGRSPGNETRRTGAGSAVHRRRHRKQDRHRCCELAKKYPQVSDTELVNYLVGGYCPVVAQMSGLSEMQKTAKVEHFAATLFEMLSEQNR